ncbi:MAG: HAD-IA family hydrolase [Pseudomonadales bacterium]|nr:HAD-IA family hydrolase [Pseudomonadales bacterium]
MSSQPPKVSAVIFDADGVVQKSSLGWLDEVRKLCGIGGGEDEFVEEVFAAEKPSLIGNADFKVALLPVLAKWNSEYRVQDALQVWTMIEPDDGVFNLIRAIRRKGTIVALATNQQEHRLNYMLNDLGYSSEFDHLLCSCRLGLAKPSVEFFEKAVEILGLPAGELLFIDDHEKNVESAKKSGLNARRFHLDDGLDALVDLVESYRIPVG